MNVDLHTHTNASDGSLSPPQLIQRAKKCGVYMLSITDHDTVSAYENINNQTLNGVKLITGIEFSSQWLNNNIHIIGLNIDLTVTDLHTAISTQQQLRFDRAMCIAEKLTKKLNVSIKVEDVKELTKSQNLGRPHFAEYLIHIGIVKDAKDAFNKYLGLNKVGDAKTNWLDLATIIDVIQSANGVAVLAHPAKYKFTQTKLSKLIDAFKTYGGKAVEVISGQQTNDITQQLAKLVQQKELFASCGSDFHQPQPWSDLGQVTKIPSDCKPVWELF